MTKLSDSADDAALKLLNTLPGTSLIPGIFRKSPFHFLSEAARLHGDFARLTIGPKSVYLVSSPSIFQHILRDNVRHYQKSRFLYNAAKPMVGEGLLTSEGETWLRQRRMMQPYFHRYRVAAFASMMVDVVTETMAAWDRDGQRDVDIGAYMAQVTVDITSRTLFGTSTLSPDDITSLGRDMMSAANYVALRGYMPFVPRSIPMPGHKRFHSAIGRLTQAVNTIIEAGKQSGDDDSLIMMLLDAVDEETNQRMTRSQLFDEVMTIFSAGFETTATALTWLWTLIARNPEVGQKLRDEVDTVLQGRTPTVDDVPKLTYARQVMQEAMRFYPPIPMLPRTATADDVIEGYHVPKGSIFLMFYYGLHHNPKYWDAPETFDPERFSSANRDARHRFAFIPFSAGPRQCIGSEFAMMESTLVLAMMMQHYHIEVAPDQAIQPNLSATLKPNRDIRATLHRRA
jgi:cytochrome P450